MVASASAAKAAEKWSKTADLYARYFEPTIVVAGRYMLNLMKLQYSPDDGLRILEAGAGGGALAKELLSLPGLSLSEFVATDIADGMLEKCKERLKDCIATERMPTIKIEKQDFTKFESPDAYFDRYYANMCLHYAESPNAVIIEACRVLKPGGMAGFTIWGREDQSPLFTIVPNVLHDFDLQQKDPTKRSNFHLGGDDEKLRNRFFDHGFSKCTLVHYVGAIECFDPAYFVELIIDGAASTKEQVESFSIKDQKRVREEVYDRGKAILDRGEPLSLDIIMILAQK